MEVNTLASLAILLGAVAVVIGIVILVAIAKGQAKDGTKNDATATDPLSLSSAAEEKRLGSPYVGKIISVNFVYRGEGFNKRFTLFELENGMTFALHGHIKDIQRGRTAEIWTDGEVLRVEDRVYESTENDVIRQSVVHASYYHAVRRRITD